MSIALDKRKNVRSIKTIYLTSLDRFVVSPVDEGQMVRVGRCYLPNHDLLIERHQDSSDRSVKYYVASCRRQKVDGLYVLKPTSKWYPVEVVEG